MTAASGATRPPAAASAKPTGGVAARGPGPSYRVTGSKKGGFPVAVEKRGHKRVTVIRNVTGDRALLLAALKKRLGCGGIVNEHGDVEVQGERRPAVERLLAELGCLQSVSKATQSAATPARPAKAKAVEPSRIDKKMALARAPAKDVSGVELLAITEKAAKQMKPKELKAHLKAAGLPIQGNKNELLARLLEHIN